MLRFRWTTSVTPPTTGSRQIHEKAPAESGGFFVPGVSGERACLASTLQAQVVGETSKELDVMCETVRHDGRLAHRACRACCADRRSCDVDGRAMTRLGMFRGMVRKSRINVDGWGWGA